MGAQTFIADVESESCAQAFKEVTDQARYDYGHAGYSGTIAEKHEFQCVDGPDDVASMSTGDIYAWIDEQLTNVNGEDPPFWDDKWGPAACLKVGDGRFFFFGWASS